MHHATEQRTDSLALRRQSRPRWLMKRLIRSRRIQWFLLFTLAALVPVQSYAQPQHYVVIDEDAMGPAGTDMNAILVFLQAPNVKVLGITVVTGDGWRDEEVAHTLRLLQLMGRTDIPVVPGAEQPLIRTARWTRAWEQMHGTVTWLGAWNNPASRHAPDAVPVLPEGAPTIQPAREGAAEFLDRMVRQHPHQVTIYAGGPMTNLATAILLDPHFAELAKELVFMGGSIHPNTDDPEFSDNPHHEFNLWFDPEAARIVLRAHWARITATPVDISIQTRLTAAMLRSLAATHTAAAQYIARYTEPSPGEPEYMWDELAAAAWLDPSLVTRWREAWMNVSLDRGASYGDTLVWSQADKPPALSLEKVRLQMKVDNTKFVRIFLKLMSAPSPAAVHPLMLQQGTVSHDRPPAAGR